jgi:hypothetical protein
MSLNQQTMCSRNQPRRRRRTRLGLLLPICLLLVQPTFAADMSTPARMFAEAMARMMDAMGLLDGGGTPPVPMPVVPPAMPSPDAMMPGTAGMMPGMDDMAQWMQQLPHAAELPGMPGWQRTSLEGIWEGRAGGLLIVQAHRFRLYNSNGEYIDGLIQARDDRIAIYDPERDIVRPYEFAQHQGRLVLRDSAGQVYLYRRLWLEDDLASAAQGNAP